MVEYKPCRAIVSNPQKQLEQIAAELAKASDAFPSEEDAPGGVTVVWVVKNVLERVKQMAMANQRMDAEFLRLRKYLQDRFPNSLKEQGQLVDIAMQLLDDFIEPPGDA